MARIAVAGLQHETNTFVPVPTELRDFETAAYEGGTRRGIEVLELVPGPMPAGGFIARATALGHNIVPIVCAYAEPGGLITRTCFEALAGEIVAGLVLAGPVDAIYLDLHGAMTCVGIDDADAELIARVRAVAGATPIVCSLDLHGNLTEDTLAEVDVAVAFRTYPHIDAAETGARAADLLERRLVTGRRPHRAFRKLPFLVPLDRQSTFLEPARTLYAELTELEARTGIWSMSLMMGFIQSDLPFVGPSVFAYGDDAASTEAAVDRLCQAILAQEPAFQSSLLTPQAAAAAAKVWDGAAPLIIADVHDNAGGGASSDAMDLIRALLAAGVDDVAVGMVYDPQAVAGATSAGPGATVRLALGGRGNPGDRPLEADFRVVRLNEAPVRTTGPMAQGQVVDLGATALLSLEGVEIVVTSKRTQCLDQAYFRHLGIEPMAKRIVVVKSSNHFRADFEPIAGGIIGVAGLGLCTADPAAIPYTRLRSGVRLHGGGPPFG